MSAVEESTADAPVEVIQVLFALHQGFGAQELVGPVEVLTNALQKINDPGRLSNNTDTRTMFFDTPIPQRAKPLNAQLLLPPQQ